MRKKILSIVAILGIAAIAAINVNLSSNTNFSNLMLRNIEALASGELTPGSMTEAEFAKLGCKATFDRKDKCKAKNGITYSWALPL